MHFFLYEKTLRLTFFFGMLAWMAAWEYGFERKKRVDSKAKRWLNNLGMAAVDSVILQSGVFLLPVSFAYAARSRGIGIFNQFYGMDWEKWIATVILLDLSFTSSTSCFIPCRFCGGCIRSIIRI